MDPLSQRLQSDDILHNIVKIALRETGVCIPLFQAPIMGVFGPIVSLRPLLLRFEAHRTYALHLIIDHQLHVAASQAAWKKARPFTHLSVN